MSDKKKYVAFLDEKGKFIDGMFIVIQEHPLVKIDTGENIVTIPPHRLLKIKEKKGDGE